MYPYLEILAVWAVVRFLFPFSYVAATHLFQLLRHWKSAVKERRPLIPLAFFTPSFLPIPLSATPALAGTTNCYRSIALLASTACSRRLLLLMAPADPARGTARRERTYPLMSRADVETLIAQGRSIVIVDQYVMKLDAWIPYHPGGRKSIMHMVGKDATDEVNGFVWEAFLFWLVV